MASRDDIPAAGESPRTMEQVPAVRSAAGVSHDHVRAMDAAAGMMISLLFFMLACVVFAAWRLHRRSRRPSPLDGLEDDQESGRAKAPGWERDPDWWRK